DYSVFGPYNRKWTVIPGTGFEFAGGTSDTSANPNIAFTATGDYIVTLDLSVNGEVKSSESLNIGVGNDLAIQVNNHPEGKQCDCDFDQIELSATGAIDYSWEISGADTLKADLNQPTGDTVLLQRRNEYTADQSYNIGVKVIGEMGTCSDTLLLSYEILKPLNDNIARAILLNYGESEVFTNICASIEDGEPIPPYTSCTGQLSWCDEYGTGLDIVENSVWFKFVASSTGLVSLSSTGFDNQIALYEADSYEDVLTGNYMLLGANDDRTDNDPRPLIKSATIIPGQTYWIQVDGSGGGLEEDFTLRITELIPTSSHEEPVEVVRVYPQPANESVTIQCDNIQGKAILCLYNIIGDRLLNQVLEMENGKADIMINTLQEGLYVFTLLHNGRQYMGRILKQ
ncbi:MAG: T9SS type A sorting domain-containing protein, partial [Bacteroidales bacterium]|nr:T9SS type A sorting domain-containing protein [Bacteroidales bacterium]